MISNRLDKYVVSFSNVLISHVGYGPAFLQMTLSNRCSCEALALNELFSHVDHDSPCVQTTDNNTDKQKISHSRVAHLLLRIVM